MVAASARCAIAFSLSPGQAGDAPDLGLIPVVPPNPQRIEPWQINTAIYRKRNEVERLFRRLKGFRRLFRRFDKLDFVFIAFIYFALIAEALQ